MKIEILGPGCPKCRKVFSHAQQAIAESGASVELVKVEKIEEITSYGVMITPALAVDGEVKVVGRVPTVNEIQELITSST